MNNPCMGTDAIVITEFGVNIMKIANRTMKFTF